MCSNPDCPSCNEDAHEECPLMKMKSIVSMLNKQVNERKTTISQISEIDNMFINKLKQSSFVFVKDSQKRGLSNNSLQILEDIFERKNGQSIKGKEAG